jgi:hypothetical protein
LQHPAHRHSGTDAHQKGKARCMLWLCFCSM